MRWITLLLALVNALLADRSRLAIENIALRQQVAVLKRSVKRAHIDDSDRVFWILMRRLLASWRDTLLIVKPETVIRWHRKGWKYYWRRKSLQGKPGRPAIDPDVVELIRRMSRDNVTWGAPRIHSELALLGHHIAESTVAKYMTRHPRQPTQTWRTFLANHMSVTAACDFFVVPSLTFKPLYCLVVLSHDRRRIVHVNVTRHPTDEWTARQILEAFPGDRFVPTHLHRDRDSIYGSAFRKTMVLLGIKQVISARKSPWQNPFAERVIGSIRRECTDHIIALGERHLVRVLRRYATSTSIGWISVGLRSKLGSLAMGWSTQRRRESSDTSPRSPTTRQRHVLRRTHEGSPVHLGARSIYGRAAPGADRSRHQLLYWSRGAYPRAARTDHEQGSGSAQQDLQLEKEKPDEISKCCGVCRRRVLGCRKICPRG